MTLHLSTDHKHKAYGNFLLHSLTNERRIQRIPHSGARLILLENTAAIVLSKSISTRTHSL